MQTTWKQRGFSTIEIPSETVPGNDVDFSISEITSKKYVEMTQKFVTILSSTYRCNDQAKSTLLYLESVTLVTLFRVRCFYLQLTLRQLMQPDLESRFIVPVLLGLSQIPVFIQAPLLVLDYRWSHNVPPIEGLLPVTVVEPTLFRNLASKVAGLQVNANTPDLTWSARWCF